MDYKLLWYPNLFNYALLFDGLERWVLLIKLDWLAQTCNVQNVLPLLLIYRRVNSLSLGMYIVHRPVLII